jgi:hypothetical protein
VSPDDTDTSKTEKMWASVAADLERLAEANETLNRTCEQLRLELLEARRRYDDLKASLQGRSPG